MLEAQSVLGDSFRALGTVRVRKRFQGDQKRAWGLLRTQVEAFSRESDYLGESQEEKSASA